MVMEGEKMNIIELEREIEKLRIDVNSMLKANPLSDYWAGKLTGLEQVLKLLNEYIDTQEEQNLEGEE